MKKLINIISALLVVLPTTGMAYERATIRNDVGYPTEIISEFYNSCKNSFYNKVKDIDLDSVARSKSEHMCGCIMDEIRADFSYKEFLGGALKIAELMTDQYSDYCYSTYKGRL